MEDYSHVVDDGGVGGSAKWLSPDNSTLRGWMMWFNISLLLVAGVPVYETMTNPKLPRQ